MDKNYTVYHLHTESSLLDSCTNYKLYVDKAVELGQTAIAFTEHGNIYNWIEKKMYVNQYRIKIGEKIKGFHTEKDRAKFIEKENLSPNDYELIAPLKYIHGVEIYLTAQLELKVRDNYHTILLAKNYEGVKEINLLLEKATDKDHMYYKPRLSFEEFFNISNNVIKISACLASPLNQYPSSTNDIYKRIQELNKEREEKTFLEKNKLNNQELEDKWVKSFEGADPDHGIPWAWRCTPHEAWIEEIENNIKELNKYYEKKISDLNDQIENAKVNYLRLLETYDYYEIQPHAKSAEQIKYNQMLYKASQRYNKPLIAGTDTHSINQYKAECRSILQKAKHIQFSNEDEFDLSYKNYNELVEMFQQQGALPISVILEAIENTNRMADSIEDFVLDTSVKYPKLYDDEEKVLNHRIAKMLKDKLDKGIIDKKDLPKYKANIKEEMRVFKKINMVGFMLFMSELVCWCWDNGIPIGFCRGSVGGSTVAYITDIIDVDPVKWNTIFSRFANESREEVGDIDIDIAPDQRELVYKHIIDSFGYDKTAYILAIGTISDKGTIDEIGRALDVPLDEVAKIKELYSSYKETIESCSKRIKEIESFNEFEQIKDIDIKVLKEKASINTEFESLYKLKDEYRKKQSELENAEKAMYNLQHVQYPDLFYYFDGLNGTAVSQSFHPAGIVVSPITLPDNYGVFWNDGKKIMYINMEEIHDGAGLVKYDLLALKNIQIIRKTCEYAGIKYPKSHEINWVDQKVWKDVITSPAGIFQFESTYAFQMLQDFKPTCINHLSMVNASLRPSGASYRDRLLAGEINKNPSPIIDELLKDNRGFLIFQEDVIAFLQRICGLSGSKADNVRRAIGRKQMDRLQAALPEILEGYCNKSDQPRDIAEEEAKTFLKIIEDASSYMFGFNHSTGYSMVGYACAYLRYYYPEEFIAAYLNCASNSDDIRNGTELAKIKGVKINNIKFGYSRADYTVDKRNHVLYKGIESIKFCNANMAEELFELAKNNKYKSFPELLKDIGEKTSLNSRQLTILTGLDFFSNFGKNKYLLDIIDIYNKFATCKQIKKDKMESLGLTEYLMAKYAGKETPKQYSQIDNIGLINELTQRLDNKALNIIEQVKLEKQFLEYVVYTNPNVSNQYYIVTEFTQYKNPSTPYMVLHRIYDGEDIKSRIKQGKIFKEQPFGEYSILKINEFSMQNKKKCIAGVWQETDDLEPILTSYEVIK